jgi:hypothetical protein
VRFAAKTISRILSDDAVTVEIEPGRVAVERLRDFGDAWMGLSLWRLLGLEDFFSQRVKPARKDLLVEDDRLVGDCPFLRRFERAFACGKF